jgi:hypothetical protein
MKVAVAIALIPAASAYYHFTRYQSRYGPFNAMVEKFDLASLPGKTVSVIIDDTAPPELAAGDTWTGLVSQIRAAAKVWDGVGTSALRVAFGGFRSQPSASASPQIEVTFGELAPGIVGMGGPVSRGEVVSGPDGAFVAILRSQVVLPKNLQDRAVGGERFYLTVVHELGHTLGLQHSWTSGVMSTEVTRASTKASPLGPDDVAGISLLYPTPGFAQNTGTITGRVLLEGGGAHLASVVALTPAGAAVSTLTLPDGSYELKGLPAGNYFVYVHPLPPPLPGEPTPVNLVLPRDSAGDVPPSAYFNTQFWPGTAIPQQTVEVAAGAATELINFQVTRRNAVSLHSVQTYSFLTNQAVKPATLWPSLGPVGSVVMAGAGLVTGTAPAPGLNISVLGNSEGVQKVSSYTPSPQYYLQADFSYTEATVEGPRHLLFTLGNESYVLPSGVQVMKSLPPSIAAMQPNADGSVTLTATGANGGTKVLFDGAAGTVRSFSPETGQLVVAPPPAHPGYRATVVLLNADGQSSLFTQAASAWNYTYEAAESPRMTVNATSVPAGVETVLEVTGVGTRFLDAPPVLAFGSPDIVTKKTWALNQTRALVQVATSAEATQEVLTVNALSGLQTTAGAGALVLQRVERAMYLAQPEGAGYYQGFNATLKVKNPPPVVAGLPALLLNDVPVTVLSYSDGDLTFRIPGGQAMGPAVVRAVFGAEASQPGVIQIEQAPIAIVGATSNYGTPVTQASPARPGNIYLLLVSGLAAPGTNFQLSRPRIFSVMPDGTEVEHGVYATQLTSQPGTYAVMFSLNPNLNVQPIPLKVSMEGRVSGVWDLPYLP